MERTLPYAAVSDDLIAAAILMTTDFGSNDQTLSEETTETMIPLQAAKTPLDDEEVDEDEDDDEEDDEDDDLEDDEDVDEEDDDDDLEDDDEEDDDEEEDDDTEDDDPKPLRVKTRQ